MHTHYRDDVWPALTKEAIQYDTEIA